MYITFHHSIRVPTSYQIRNKAYTIALIVCWHDCFWYSGACNSIGHRLARHDDPDTCKGPWQELVLKNKATQCGTARGPWISSCRTMLSKLLVECVNSWCWCLSLFRSLLFVHCKDWWLSPHWGSRACLRKITFLTAPSYED